MTLWGPSWVQRRGTEDKMAKRPPHLGMAGRGRGSWRTRLARKCSPLKLTETLLLTERCHNRSRDPTNREAPEVSSPRAGREGEQGSPAVAAEGLSPQGQCAYLPSAGGWLVGQGHAQVICQLLRCPD